MSGVERSGVMEWSLYFRTIFCICFVCFEYIFCNNTKHISGQLTLISVLRYTKNIATFRTEYRNISLKLIKTM